MPDCRVVWKPLPSACCPVHDVHSILGAGTCLKKRSLRVKVKSYLSIRWGLKEVQGDRRVRKEQCHVPTKQIYFFVAFQMQFSIQKKFLSQCKTSSLKRCWECVLGRERVFSMRSININTWRAACGWAHCAFWVTPYLCPPVFGAVDKQHRSWVTLKVPYSYYRLAKDK